MIACDVNETKEYVLKEERELPEDQQTVFELRVLDLAIREMIENEEVGGRQNEDETEIAVRSGAVRSLRLKHGIRGWRNMRSRSGDEVPCTKTREHGREVLNQSALTAIMHKRAELAKAVADFNGLDEDDEGNSLDSRPSPAMSASSGSQDGS